MLTLNCGKSICNVKPSDVSDQDWMGMKKERLQKLFQSYESTHGSINLFFGQELDGTGGVSSESLENVSGLKVLKHTRYYGDKNCSFIFYQPDEWEHLPSHRNDVSFVNSYNPPEFQGKHNDMDNLTTLKNDRMCAALLQPKSGDYRRRFFGGVPLPPSIQDDISSIKVLAVCFHLRRNGDRASRKYECKVLLRALGSYAKHCYVSVIVGGDFNMTKEDISEIISGLDPELRDRISLRFPPSPLLGCRSSTAGSGPKGNIDGFIMISARSGMSTCLGGSFCADGEAEMVPLDPYLDPDKGSRHFLFDHEPVYLNYRLELDRNRVLQQLEDGRQTIARLELKLQEHDEKLNQLLPLLQNRSIGLAQTTQAIASAQPGIALHLNTFISPPHIQQTDAAQNIPGADLQGPRPVTFEENNMQKRAPSERDQEVANDEVSNKKQRMESNGDGAGPSRPLPSPEIVELDDSDDSEEDGQPNNEEDGQPNVDHPQRPKLEDDEEFREVQCGGTKALWVLKKLPGDSDYDYEAKNEFWVTSGPSGSRNPCTGRDVELANGRDASKKYKTSLRINNGAGTLITLQDYIRIHKIQMEKKKRRDGTGHAVEANPDAVSNLKIKIKKALMEVGFSDASADSLLNSEDFRPKGRDGSSTIDWTLKMPDKKDVRSFPDITRWRQQQQQPPST